MTFWLLLARFVLARRTPIISPIAAKHWGLLHCNLHSQFNSNCDSSDYDDNIVDISQTNFYLSNLQPAMISFQKNMPPCSLVVNITNNDMKSTAGRHPFSINQVHLWSTTICHERIKGASFLIYAMKNIHDYYAPKDSVAKNAIFHSSKSANFVKNFCHKSRILPVFRHSKMRPFQQRTTVTAVNLFYEVLPKQFEAFGFYFSQEQKQVTAEYWVSWTTAVFAWNHTVSWQIINHYILECLMVKLMI